MSEFSEELIERHVNRRFTKSQLRAFEWLPADGSSIYGLPRNISAAVHSLILSHHRLCDSEWGTFGQRGGRKLRVWLTPLGVETKRRLQEKGKIPL